MNVSHESQLTALALSGSINGPLSMALCDEIECGLIVSEADGRVHFVNRAARQELAGGRLLALQGDVLRRAAGASGDLELALRQAAQRGRRSLVRLHQGSDRLMASTLPFEPAGSDSTLVLVVLGRRHACSDLGLELLASSYGLTLAERRVLAALVHEASPRQIAADHAVKLSTVRTQISAIRSKLGTRNIEGLLLRAAEVPPVASALRLAFAPAAPLQAAA